MWHLAQLNVARPLAPLDSAQMADFVRDLPVINALADAAPGFVWRLRDEDGQDATSLRPYGPETMVNMSVWESVEALRDFVYRGPHLNSLRRRREWFDYAGIEAHLVLWWIPAGVTPTLDEARDRLELLIRKGPGPDAFTLRRPYPPPDQVPSG
ncbi:MAG: DUF3291 domain-containing protein [Micromonosporaceae bacterium]|jgi:hypothetical protein|nr:DUF3291 domain-containing protein [Micromonosporaceae bacterium]